MAIPDLQIFEDFLVGARVVESQPTAGPSELVLQATESPHGPGSEVWLAYQPGELQLDSVLRKISEGLEAVGTPSTREIALSVLALIVGTKGAERIVQHANRLLSQVRPGELSINYLWMGPPPRTDIRADFDTIRVEPFDPSRLEYWAQKRNARWPIDPKELRGRTAFVTRLDVTLINIDRIPGAERLSKNWAGRATSLVDPYFQRVSDALRDQLATDTSRRLSLVEAAGLWGLDLSRLVNLLLGIHLFTWPRSGSDGAGCWAVCHQPGFVLNLPGADPWTQARQWLLAEFRLDSLEGRDRPIGFAAQTFAGLMQDARNHMDDGRMREAFLYFVIALDQLLGEDGRSVVTVADRTSVLTHRMRSKTFSEEVARVRHVYDARSRLVHSGIPVALSDMRDAEALATSVLWAITRAVADEIFDTRDSWVSKIDALAHLFQGDPSVVTEERLAEVGAVSTFSAGPPPPKLRDRGGFLTA